MYYHCLCWNGYLTIACANLKNVHNRRGFAHVERAHVNLVLHILQVLLKPWKQH